MLTYETLEAINEIANQFRLGNLVLLTESDLKTALSNKISQCVEENITVNTESPWYDTYDTNSTFFIDITAFDREKLKLVYDSTTHRKGYKYDDEALVIELKYFRYNDDIDGIAGDFNKMRSLTKAIENNCFIIAAARTKEIFEVAEKFMQHQMFINREKYNNRLKAYLFGPEKIIKIT